LKLGVYGVRAKRGLVPKGSFWQGIAWTCPKSVFWTSGKCPKVIAPLKKRPLAIKGLWGSASIRLGVLYVEHVLVAVKISDGFFLQKDLIVQMVLYSIGPEVIT